MILKSKYTVLARISVRKSAMGRDLQDQSYGKGKAQLACLGLVPGVHN